MAESNGEELAVSEDAVHLEDMELDGAKPQPVDRIGLVSGTRGAWDRLARPDAREALPCGRNRVARDGPEPGASGGAGHGARGPRRAASEAENR